MKKIMVLLAGGLFASLASANTTGFNLCQGVIVGYSSSTTGTLTCTPGFTLPFGDTLTGVDFLIEQDSETPGSSTATVTGTYTNTSPSFTESITETSQAGVSFGSCTATPVAGPCPVELSFAGPNGPFTVNYSVAYTNGGIATNGATGISLYVEYDYTLPAPEPATLAISGVGLIALGLFAKKRRKSVA